MKKIKERLSLWPSKNSKNKNPHTTQSFFPAGFKQGVFWAVDLTNFCLLGKPSTNDPPPKCTLYYT